VHHPFPFVYKPNTPDRRLHRCSRGLGTITVLRDWLSVKARGGAWEPKLSSDAAIRNPVRESCTRPSCRSRAPTYVLLSQPRAIFRAHRLVRPPVAGLVSLLAASVSEGARAPQCLISPVECRARRGTRYCGGSPSSGIPRTPQ
jgi:hypothetical protein